MFRSALNSFAGQSLNHQRPAFTGIKSEMEKNIPASGGRLSVKFEEYSAGGPKQRIPKATALKNILKTL